MSDFKPAAIPAGLLGERFGGFITAYNEQSQMLHPFKGSLLDYLKPYRDGRDYAWQGIVGTAMSLTSHRTGAGRANERLYGHIEKFAKVIQKESDKRPLGEFSDYRVNELLILASDIAFSRARPRHGRTQSPVPADIIYELAVHYSHCTGREPGAGAGPFADFVAMFWEATGHKRKYNTVVSDIKKAHKARPTAFRLSAG